MTEIPETDVARLAGMIQGRRHLTTVRIARQLLEQGVTLPPPPPDPAVVVAEYIWRDCIGDIWRPESYEPAAMFLAAVRDLFTPEALTAAAAKVQEADRDTVAEYEADDRG